MLALVLAKYGAAHERRGPQDSVRALAFCKQEAGGGYRPVPGIQQSAKQSTEGWSPPLSCWREPPLRIPPMLGLRQVHRSRVASEQLNLLS